MNNNIVNSKLTDSIESIYHDGLAVVGVRAEQGERSASLTHYLKEHLRNFVDVVDLIDNIH